MENAELLENGFNTGILLIVFNRPELTKQMFEAVKVMQPKRLYIASDGPRMQVEEDAIKVAKTRSYLLSNIDWPCTVQKLFRDENLGCGTNVKLSIDWFFEHEENGIILEDDCVAVPGFFGYCEELLGRYNEDQRIGMISGNNHFTKYYKTNDSYLFSKYKNCLGWATWKRAWQHMDLEMTWLNTEKKKDVLKNMGYGKVSYYHWKNAIRKIEKKIVDAWDWQWYFSLATQNQLCIFPQENLIANIGFGKEATHSIGKPKKSYVQVKDLSFPLRHPQFVLVDKVFDYTFEKKKLRRQIILDLFPQTLKNRIKKLVYRR